MRALIKQTFPRMAPLVTAGIVRVDDPKADVNEPTREHVRPHAHAHAGRRVVVSQKTAMTLAAMTAKREREGKELRSTDEEDQEIDKRLVRDQETP